MARDINALKFFQTYMQVFVELGGENLPKTVSSQMGIKLARLYKKRGIAGIENGLKQSYEVLNATTSITKINDNTLEIITEYSDNFCPIGGGFNPNKAELIQKCICYPYTIAFLSELDPDNTHEGTVMECILKTNKNTCHYQLTLKNKR